MSYESRNFDSTFRVLTSSRSGIGKNGLDWSGSGMRQMTDSCESSNKISGSIKRSEFVWLSENLLASQKGLDSMELVGYISDNMQSGSWSFMPPYLCIHIQAGKLFEPDKPKLNLHFLKKKVTFPAQFISNISYWYVFVFRLWNNVTLSVDFSVPPHDSYVNNALPLQIRILNKQSVALFQSIFSKHKHTKKKMTENLIGIWNFQLEFWERN